RALERERVLREKAAALPRIAGAPSDEAIIAALPLDLDDGIADALAESEPEPAKPPKRRRKSTAPEAKGDALTPPAESPQPVAEAVIEPTPTDVAPEVEVASEEASSLTPVPEGVPIPVSIEAPKP